MASSLFAGVLTNLPCPDPSCLRCYRQFLQQYIRAGYARHELRELRREGYRSRVTALANDILKDYSFYRSAGPSVLGAGLQLDAKTFSEMISTAFPTLSDEDWNGVLTNQLTSEDMRTRLDDSLLLPFLRDWTQNAKTFFEGVYFQRLSNRPGDCVPSDNSALQLGWVMCAFKLIESDCFLKLDALNPRYCEIYELTVNGLHTDGMFSAPRGYLILRCQAMLYRGLSHVTAYLKKLPIASKPLTIPAPQKAVPSCVELLLSKLDKDVMPTLQDFVATYQKFLPAFGATSKNTLQEIESCARACPENKRKNWLEYAIFTKTALRASCLLKLHLFQQDLVTLRKTTREHSKGRTTYEKFLKAWAAVEDGISMLFDTVCFGALKLALHNTAITDWLGSYGNRYHLIVEAELGPNCFQRSGTAGVASLLLGYCSVWPLGAKIRIVSRYLSFLEPHIEESYKDYMEPLLNLASMVVDALDTIQPCYVGKGGSQVSLHQNDTLVGEAEQLILFASFMPAATASDAKDWTKSVWQGMFDKYDEKWTKDAKNADVRAQFRQFLGMTSPPKAEKTSKTTAGKTSTKRKVPDSDPWPCPFGSLAEPVGNTASAKTQSAADRASFWQGVAIAESADTTAPTSGSAPVPRLSQFEESLEKKWNKDPKRRKLTTGKAELEQAPVPAAPAPPAKQKLLFSDGGLYDLWRQIFPLPGSRSALQPMKWDDLRQLLYSPPLNFVEVRSSGVEFRWKRPASDGYPQFEFGAHKPHNGNIEKNLLKHLRTRLRQFTGWEAEDFLLAEGQLTLGIA